jgi:hypothetical protein
VDDFFKPGRFDMTHLSRLACGAVFFTTGCVAFPDSEKTAQVSPQFFESAPPTVAKSPPPPAAEDTLCMRVHVVGHKVLAANPQIGLRPTFATIQAPAPEIFHVDQRVIYITDGLVKQLPSEADLAAVLAFQLARMVAEREARVKQDLKLAAARPPIQLPIGGTGPMSATDMASTAELAKYDKKRSDLQQAATKINPETLARNYLEGAGFLRTDFDRVQAALQSAEKNYSLERRLKGQPGPSARSR